MRFMIAFLLLASAGQAGEVTVTRGEWSRTIRCADFSALEAAIEVDGQPGDKVHIVGEFVGGPLDMLDLGPIAGGSLTGDGPDKSRLILTAQHDRIGPEDNPQKPGGPAIMLPNNGEIRLAGLYLENTPANIHEDGALAGWPGNTTGFSIATFEDCEVKAHDWGLIYDWSLRANRTVTLRRVKGVAARTFVNLVHSASTYRLLMEDCNVGIDGNLSRSYGASSAADPVTGGVLSPILLRAGEGHVERCTFWVRGLEPAPGHPAAWIPRRIAAIATDQYFSQGAKTTRFTARNSRVLCVEPGAANVVSDLDFRWGLSPVLDNAELVAQGRGGSGVDGEVRLWKKED